MNIPFFTLLLCPVNYSGLSHINMVEQNGHQFQLVHSDRDSD